MLLAVQMAYKRVARMVETWGAMTVELRVAKKAECLAAQ